jgi:predicted TIM-barrel fold metal-dependent hydrolase
MEVIYKNRNVVGDISGFTLRDFEERFERFMLDQVREVLAYAGDPKSILFGTDWPVAGMASYRRFVEKLDLTPEEMQLVLWKNAARIFRIDTTQLGA